jgi:hypothetical protein
VSDFPVDAAARLRRRRHPLTPSTPCARANAHTHTHTHIHTHRHHQHQHLYHHHNHNYNQSHHAHHSFATNNQLSWRTCLFASLLWVLQRRLPTLSCTNTTRHYHGCSQYAYESYSLHKHHPSLPWLQSVRLRILFIAQTPPVTTMVAVSTLTNPIHAQTPPVTTMVAVSTRATHQLATALLRPIFVWGTTLCTQALATSRWGSTETSAWPTGLHEDTTVAPRPACSLAIQTSC